MRRHVYYYTYLPEPFPLAADVLGGVPARWLPRPALDDGVAWRTTLVAEGALPPAVAQRSALVDLGPSTGTDQLVVRSVGWRASSADQLFPVLTADLELSACEGSGCQLSLMGSYRPPLSVVGDVGDRLLGHRIAEACVRRFVLDVAARIEDAGVQERAGTAERC